MHPAIVANLDTIPPLPSSSQAASRQPVDHGAAAAVISAPPRAPHHAGLGPLVLPGLPAAAATGLSIAAPAPDAACGSRRQQRRRQRRGQGQDGLFPALAGARGVWDRGPGGDAALRGGEPGTSLHHRVARPRPPRHLGCVRLCVCGWMDGWMDALHRAPTLRPHIYIYHRHSPTRAQTRSWWTERGATCSG